MAVTGCLESLAPQFCPILLPRTGHPGRHGRPAHFPSGNRGLGPKTSASRLPPQTARQRRQFPHIPDTGCLAPRFFLYSPAFVGATADGTFPRRKPGTRSENVCLAPATADGPAKETIFPLIPVTLSAPPETTFGEDLPSWLRTNLPVVRDESQ